VNVTDLAESIFYKDAAQNPDQQRGKRSQIRQYSFQKEYLQRKLKGPAPQFSFKISCASVHIYM
jgi:hypothetical protein